MPPVPPAQLDDDVRALIDALERRAGDIDQFQIPRLRDCKGPLSTQQNLNAELRDDLDAFARLVENLELAAGDVSGPAQRRILGEVDRFAGRLAQFRKDARAALLASKRTIDSQMKDARAQLLQRRTPTHDANKFSEKATDDAVAEASSQVTEAMRRTMELMQKELERSVFASQTLEQSTTTLKMTTDQHDTLTSLLSTSKGLVKALERSDWLDRLLILAALAFFVLVVLFILKQRIFDRGLRIALFWTRFLPESRESRMEKGLRSATAVATSLITTATTLAAASLSATRQPPVVSNTPESEPSESAEASATPTLVDIIAETLEPPPGDTPTTSLEPETILRDEL